METVGVEWFIVCVFGFWNGVLPLYHSCLGIGNCRMLLTQRLTGPTAIVFST